MPGFGSLPGDFGDAGIPIPVPPENLEQQFADDIHAIKVKYVDGQTNKPTQIQLAANQALAPILLQGQRVNALLLTAVTGIINVYLYDVSNQSGKAAFLPDLVADASLGRVSIQVMIPERDDYIIGVQEGAGSTATGSIRVMKL